MVALNTFDWLVFGGMVLALVGLVVLFHKRKRSLYQNYTPKRTSADYAKPMRLVHSRSRIATKRHKKDTGRGLYS